MPEPLKWYSAQSAEQQERVLGDWSDAPVAREELCGMLLDIAREQVLEYGVLLNDDNDPPARFVFAQLMHARNLWEAGKADENGNLGSEGYSYTPRPLDKTIKNTIRPVSGRVHVL